MNDLEQLIADIQTAKWPDGGYDGFPTKIVAEMIAARLISLGWERGSASNEAAEKFASDFFWHDGGRELNPYRQASENAGES